MDIYLDHPSIGKLELDYVSRATREGEVSTRSKYVDMFEERLAAYLKVPPSSVIATNSGTTALYLATRALFYKSDRSFYLPDLTYIATYNALRLVGDITLKDVNPTTWCYYDTPHNHTVLVDLYGYAWPKTDCALIDSCESLGRDILADTCHIFSFNHNKTVTCGGGGAIVGLPPVYGHAVRVALSQGLAGEHFTGFGTNGRMTGLHAGLGLAQLERASELLGLKGLIYRQYESDLGDLVTFQAGPSSRWMTACTTPVPADILQHELLRANIPSRRIFPPLHMLRPTVDAHDFYPNAEHIYQYGICLPSSVLNTGDAILHVCSHVRRIIKEYKP